ncbi:hypothetical protein [Oceanobacillus kapialis]|uniref:hypothetical protein n=1 Tax=Oceanobacillus kapialis TaxID=481353 RepID=UPI00384C85FE
MKLFNSKGERIFYLIYTTIMLLLYLGFVGVENHRITTGTANGSGAISEEEGQAIAQIGAWSQNLELIFLGLFIIVMIVMYFRAFKNKEVIKLFLVMNTVLFAGIIVLSLLLLLLTSVPFGNLIQPLFFPVLLMLIFLPFVKMMKVEK